jgi:hypothetical protein
VTVEDAFIGVRGCSASINRRLGNVLLRPCAEVRKNLRGAARARAFMHVGHTEGAVCFDAAMRRLPLNHAVGILLHEFGHLGSGGGEAEADQWVLAKLGIAIRYKGRLCLEWVDDKAVRLAVRA